MTTFMTTDKRQTAVLLLEDGRCFSGVSCGASGEVQGELNFNTAMIGYPEVISDPAYAGSILVMTYPQIGNYGIARVDTERDRVALRGLVVRDLCDTPSSFRSDLSLPEYLIEQGVVALCEIDTRALVHHVREQGSMRAILSTLDSDPQSLEAKLRGGTGQGRGSEGQGRDGQGQSSQGQDGQGREVLVAEVSTKAPWVLDTELASAVYPEWMAPLPKPKRKIMVIDCGVTHSTLRHLARAGCAAAVVPWDTSLEVIRACQPDGLFISGGPGHPKAATEALATTGFYLGNLPVFGVGLGHQLLALAAGGQVEKLRCGHHGNNYPVLDLQTLTVGITSQHHNYTVAFESLGLLVPGESGGVAVHPSGSDLRFWVKRRIAPVVKNKRFGRIQLTHININDGTVEGLRFLDIPALSAQFHPTVPLDATSPHPLYKGFTALMDERDNATSGTTRARHAADVATLAATANFAPTFATAPGPSDGTEADYA